MLRPAIPQPYATAQQPKASDQKNSLIQSCICLASSFAGSPERFSPTYFFSNDYYLIES